MVDKPALYGTWVVAADSVDARMDGCGPGAFAGASALSLNLPWLLAHESSPAHSQFPPL